MSILILLDVLNLLTRANFKAARSAGAIAKLPRICYPSKVFVLLIPV